MSGVAGHTVYPGLRADGGWQFPACLNMAAQALDHPEEQVALIDLTSGARRDVRYGELRQMVDMVARDLMRRVQPGDRVGVLLSQSVDCAVAHLAIWKIGAISVPLFKLFQHDALASRIGDAGLELVLTDGAGAEQLGVLARPLLVADILSASADHSGHLLPYAETTPETPAVLIYTSGTTGSAKGALHGHRVLSGHLPGVAISHDHLGQPGDCLWTPADWAWIGGLFDVLMPGLALGVPVVAARLDKFTPEACAEVVARGDVRNVFFPPTALRLLKAAGQGLDGLRSVASGGESLGAEMLAWGQRHLGVTINEFYGQTECNMTVSSCAADFPVRPGCIGKPVPGCVVEVIDTDGTPTKGEGDVAVRRGAASMMLEYWNRPEATAEKFRGDWLVTGDRGIWEGDYLRFVGREDDVITSAGYRIGPAEIEDCLMTHPAVATVGVVGKPDALRTEIVKAYVVLKAGATATEKELQDHVKQRLASYSYPREVAFVEALPMTVTGKVIRKELKARAAGEEEG
ncbi:AMP-binding protein [Phaeobacter gallaeciensis]|uniref:Acyl-coenzyme A synthetase/AMP-(Fatty) acid ligase n=1 Tax=Phaeobacter gallaeciensis TaxID=60890 RepID=A0AAD0EDI9_9RHOB|nr:AMP-binding protein [Phaeobacter gallaeciensis]AHD10207.1 Acyl-coenzyme A synthetase/AMP-(fatty) acid ligase [Phaeobacter gallaeciensis DSM 26640]ATE93471.1 Acyl-coenzyme A synthetase/AMP-(fatty) acid ligase [Phaeobacter gallaeciensis]ATE96708.1 Acyl-coenzyme A synthetase/AMP-(fatty) acid ligase [Phaeobacter gallaeciensis]ATF02135.1 Acyl-coenzyme A synthetase/AMP-(fatty) acid ligase [Phaeobacter gallaeciensis]ATF06515.1 Acyl-coenzyme A synthetase/AMP-(fatty) acid ligase [Phaeobacter gallaec